MATSVLQLIPAYLAPSSIASPLSSCCASALTAAPPRNSLSTPSPGNSKMYGLASCPTRSWPQKTIYNPLPIWYHLTCPGDVAQLEERDNRTVEARGSSPLISTTCTGWAAASRG